MEIAQIVPIGDFLVQMDVKLPTTDRLCHNVRQIADLETKVGANIPIPILQSLLQCVEVVKGVVIGLN